MNKKIIFLFIWLCGLNVFYAQQEPSFNQYALESSVINPAYATSDQVKSFGLSYRKQNDNIYAPESFMAFGHVPISDKIETSFRIMSDDIGNGVINQKFIGLNMAYIIDVNALSKVSFGIMAGVNSVSSNLSGITLEQGTVIDDNAFQYMENNKFSPLVGVGIFYYMKNLFIGLSVPSLVKSDNVFIDESKITVLSKSEKYLSAGYVYEYSNEIKIKPSILLKYNDGIFYPNLMLNALFSDRFEIGYMNKVDVSNNFLAGFNINDNIKINFCYELYNKKNNPLYKTGLELGIIYKIYPEYYKRIVSPRYY
jgi:type IX secretion system PorP/SprF family membrane protein